ncbi:MAG: isoprenyl transferase [Candidatus Dadabacteria bacterium]|nr:isoprenyl transferase [Candidatus Dadabacteria bacterium]
MELGIKEIDTNNLPGHIVIIMDGNGRWAQKHNLDRISGHREGMKSVKSIIRASRSLGIKYLTLYAFSAQNWSRPQAEVSALMELLKYYLIEEGNTLVEKDIRLNAIGRLGSLPVDARRVLEKTIDMTKQCKGMILTLALSYGGREEIVDAVKGILTSDDLSTEDINEKLFSSHLYTSNLPDPDLLIRTSGEHRISNLLLWQLAYTEIYFTKTLWPDFRKRHLIKAITNYQNRERRFGLTGDQLKKRELI